MHDLHAIDASSSLVAVHPGVHRVDNPRGQTCELVCKAAPKLRACIRLEVLFRLKRRHDHFIRATCNAKAAAGTGEVPDGCLVVLLKYGALLSDPGQHGMLRSRSLARYKSGAARARGSPPLNATLKVPARFILSRPVLRLAGLLLRLARRWGPPAEPPFTIRSAVETRRRTYNGGGPTRPCPSVMWCQRRRAACRRGVMGRRVPRGRLWSGPRESGIGQGPFKRQRFRPTPSSRTRRRCPGSRRRPPKRAARHQLKQDTHTTAPFAPGAPGPGGGNTMNGFLIELHMLHIAPPAPLAHRPAGSPLMEVIFPAKKWGSTQIAQRHAFRGRGPRIGARRLLVLACLVVVSAPRPPRQQRQSSRGAPRATMARAAGARAR